MSDTIGIIGGTGPQGRGLAMRLALAGVTVLVGSRKAERGHEIAQELNETMSRHSGGAERYAPIAGDENGAIVARSDIVFLTVPYESAEPTLVGVVDRFRQGAIFVDVTVPLAFGKGDVQLVVPEAGSGSRHLRGLLPSDIPFCAACKTLPAHVLEELAEPLDCSTFVYGDDKAAKQRVVDLLARIPGLVPQDVGGLSAAATVEGMTALLIRINRRRKSRGGRFRVVGTDA